jgi:hypothetical protein
LSRLRQSGHSRFYYWIDPVAFDPSATWAATNRLDQADKCRCGNQAAEYVERAAEVEGAEIESGRLSASFPRWGDNLTQSDGRSISNTTYNFYHAQSMAALAAGRSAPTAILPPVAGADLGLIGFLKPFRCGFPATLHRNRLAGGDRDLAEK